MLRAVGNVGHGPGTRGTRTKENRGILCRPIFVKANCTSLQRSYSHPTPGERAIFRGNEIDSEALSMTSGVVCP